MAALVTLCFEHITAPPHWESKLESCLIGLGPCYLSDSTLFFPCGVVEAVVSAGTESGSLKCLNEELTRCPGGNGEPLNNWE